MPLFIVNAISSNERKRRVARIALSKGYKVAYTEYAGHAEVLARESDEEIVVAVGGDGTVNEVARGIIGTNKTLGIIPCGSGNGLALHLGIPYILEWAIKKVESGKSKPIDVAEVNGRLFLSVCGVGLDAMVSKEFALSGKRGLISYIKQGLKTLKVYAPDNYKIAIDGVNIQTNALFITVGNSDQWGNGAKITPLAECSDGLLDVSVVEKFGAWALPGLVIRLMTGTLHRSSKVHCYKGKEIHIVRESEGVVHADGDWFVDSKELNIKIIPSAINILV